MRHARFIPGAARAAAAVPSGRARDRANTGSSGSSGRRVFTTHASAAVRLQAPGRA